MLRRRRGELAHFAQELVLCGWVFQAGYLRIYIRLYHDF